MTSLSELQRNFISDCLSAELTDENISSAPDIETTTISVKGLMSIYRESSIGNILIPMQLIYPVVEKLVGEKFFRMTCRKFIETHWPETGNMDDYGKGFAGFLQQFKPVQSIAYLADVAKLEWLYHESSIANDMSPSDWTLFSTLSEDDVEHIQINLHPSVRFCSSLFPLKEIWDMNQEGVDDTNSLNLNEASGGDILIIREDVKTKLYSISTDELVFLKSLANGKTLYEAVELAIEVNEDVNLEAVMEKHLLNGVLCTFAKKTNLHSTA